MDGSRASRVIVALSIVLVMSGFLNYYVVSSDVSAHTWILQDLSSTAVADSAELIASSSDALLGTLALLRSDVVGDLDYSWFYLLSIGTVVAERKVEQASHLRDRIVDEISHSPGIHLRELKRSVGCAMGAAQYHLGTLERDGVIVSLKNGNTKHFFMADFSSDGQMLQLAALLRNPTVAAIIQECLDNGRVTQATLSRTLDIDKSLVSYYTGSLVDTGVLRTVRVFGRERPLMLTDSALSMLRFLGV